MEATFETATTIITPPADKNFDAGIVADCLMEQEARQVIADLLKLKCATFVAAPLFGAVIGGKKTELGRRGIR